MHAHEYTDALSTHSNFESSRSTSCRRVTTATVDPLSHVEALINEGAPLDKRHTDGVTALFMAAQNGNTRSVRYLLEAGANVDRARQTDRTTPLMRAAKSSESAPIVSACSVSA